MAARLAALATLLASTAGGGGGFGFRDEMGISPRVVSIEDDTATLVISPDPSV